MTSIGMLPGVLSKICTTECVTAMISAADTDGTATTRGINWVVVIITAASLVAAAIAAWRVSRRPVPLEEPPVLQTDLLNPDLPLLPEPRIVLASETALLIVLGVYLFFDRAGAWIHVPSTPLFIGELTMLAGLFAISAHQVRLGAAVRESPALKALVFWMAWGGALLVLAIARYGQNAIRDSALWYYGLVAAFVAFLLLSNPGRLGRWLVLYRKVMPYALLWFPFALILNARFSGIGLMVPFSQVPIVSHKSGNVAVFTTIFLAYIWLVDGEARAYSDTQRTILTAGGVLVVLFAGMQNRGGLVSAAAGLMIAILLMRRRKTEFAFVAGGAVVIVLTLAIVSNLNVPLFGGRSVSAEQLITNVSSIIDPDSGSSRQTSTTQWRLEIWGTVLQDVTESAPIMGFGPGPDLGEIYGFGGSATETLRNPHNSHVGVLARMGFVGMVTWAGLWTVWVIQLLLLRQRLLRRGRNAEAAVGAWLVSAAAAILVNAIFDPTLEGPQVAVWLWTFFGVGAALPLLYAGFESMWLDKVSRRDPVRLEA